MTDHPDLTPDGRYLEDQLCWPRWPEPEGAFAEPQNGSVDWPPLVVLPETQDARPEPSAAFLRAMEHMTRARDEIQQAMCELGRMAEETR